MGQTNTQFIESLYEAFGRGDAGTVLSAFDPQITWNEAENFQYADGNPYVGPQRVAQGVFGRLMTEWNGFSLHPHTFVEQGDTVVSMGRYRGTFRATDVSVDAQYVHVWTVRNGKVASFQQYTDTFQFARAMRGTGV